MIQNKDYFDILKSVVSILELSKTFPETSEILNKQRVQNKKDKKSKSETTILNKINIMQFLGEEKEENKKNSHKMYH